MIGRRTHAAGGGAMADEARWGLVDWHAVLGDVPGFLGAMLDAHHDPVSQVERLDHYCVACGFSLEPAGREMRHAPADLEYVPAWLVQQTRSGA
jgi:hypothetical protein